jgi:hypothetical protein
VGPKGRPGHPRNLSLKASSVGREHPQWNLQSLVLCIFDRHCTGRGSCVDKDPQFLIVQRVKRVVDTDRFNLVRTRDIVWQSAFLAGIAVSESLRLVSKTLP